MDHIAGGGGSDVGNGVVTGSIVTSDGKTPVSARVLFIPSDYDPDTGNFGPEVLVDTVDANGDYRFSTPNIRTYNLQAVWGQDGSRLLLEGIRPVKDSAIMMNTDTLRKPGTLKVMLTDSIDRVNGHFYFPGTTIGASITNNAGFIEFDSIPTGTFPALYYSGKNAPAPKPVRYDISVASGATTVIYNPAWYYSRRIILNTRASGAGRPMELMVQSPWIGVGCGKPRSSVSK